MNFSTVQYLIFFVVVFALYWNLSRRNQNILLLLASYYFYACWDWRFLSLIILSTLVDFVAGRGIERNERLGRKRLFLLLSLGANLGILGYFKYFNFFAESLLGLASAVGWNISYTTANIILPVGISFYTFQTLSYTIDIYRGKLNHTDSIVDFAAFVAFFPQLVAGPIVRAREFMFQLDKKRIFDVSQFEAGLVRFLYGFFKKSFIADTLAVYLVDPVFSDPASYNAGAHWLAILGYSIQIYADFSGYSAMAIGSAQILGFHIPENFNFPYIARNISDFWRRWHMTMSRFFRDYVYIALGGNKGTFNRVIFNLAATTLISGLWHGAGWTFVVWGGLHGFYLSINQVFQRAKKRNNWGVDNPGFLRIFPAWLLTQAGAVLAWILFRSTDFGSGWQFLKGLGGYGGTLGLETGFVIWFAFATFIIDHIYGWQREKNESLTLRIPFYARALLYAAMIIFLFHARIHDVQPFIYFQF